MSRRKSTELDSDKNTKSSLLPIYILLILKDKSSPNNPLTRSKITETLKNDYEIEIGENDRKTIPRCIKTLAKHFPNSITEIKGKKGCPSAWYLDISHMPMFGITPFPAEATNMLIDIISGLNIIGNECTTSLIKKLVESLGEEEKEKIVNSTTIKSPDKCENQPLVDIKNKIEKAIDYYQEITFTYKINGEEQPVTVIPHSIKSIGGEIFLNAFSREGIPYKYFLDSISSVSIGKEVTEIYGDDEFELESESDKNVKNIALDALFSNLKKINCAIKNRQTIRFGYLGYTIKDNKLVLELKETKTIFPQSTAIKNEKYYLIAHDVNDNYCPSFYRIDRMQNIELDSVLDFMERRKFDVQERHEYLESHPYMLSGFTKRTMEFAIREDSLDHVIEAFGNKAIYCGNKKGFELGSWKIKNLSKVLPEINFSDYLGLDHNAAYCVFKVQTTEEEIKRFGLEHADVVEIERPKHIRDEIKALSEKLVKRYSKNKD